MHISLLQLLFLCLKVNAFINIWSLMLLCLLLTLSPILLQGIISESDLALKAIVLMLRSLDSSLKISSRIRATIRIRIVINGLILKLL